MEKVKPLFIRKWEGFTSWFREKEHYHSRLNKDAFFYDLLKITGLILVFLIVYYNVNKLNQIVLIFIKLGSLLLLVSIFFILRKAKHLIKNIKYSIRGFNNGTKAIIGIAIVILLFLAFLNQDKVVEKIVNNYEKTEFNKLNPITAEINLSSLGKLFSGLNVCPQINVPMQNGRIPAQVYEDWKVYQYPCDTLTSFFGCSIDCYKGYAEGQNKNYYYCGDKPQFIGKQLATVDKTPVSNDGTIGKQIRKSFVNIYASDGTFLKTICGEDPEKITEQEWNKFKKEAESFFG